MRAVFAALISIALLTSPCRADPVSDRIYPAPRAPLTSDGLPAAALIAVTTADGLTLKGLQVRGRPGMPVLLVFHGNGSSAADTISWFAPAIAQGYGVVAAEYRGYSGNPGHPSEAGLAADADAFMGLTRSVANGEPVWIVGHSLGGGVALALARRSPGALVVTVGTFTRLRDLVGGLTRSVVPDAYRNIDVVPDLTVPWFLVHGTTDPVVPWTHGQALHTLAGQAHRQGASFVIVGADHHPEGADILAVLETIRRRSPEGVVSPAGLPEAVKIVPFGQTRSL